MSEKKADQPMVNALLDALYWLERIEKDNGLAAIAVYHDRGRRGLKESKERLVNCIAEAKRVTEGREWVALAACEAPVANGEGAGDE